MVICALALAMLLNPPSPAVTNAAAKAELKKLQGTWEVTKQREGGEDAPEFKGATMTFEGSTVSMQNYMGFSEYRVHNDVATTPHRILLTPRGGGEAGELGQGYYKRAGAELVLAFGENAKQFSSTGDGGLPCVVTWLTRVKHPALESGHRAGAAADRAKAQRDAARKIYTLLAIDLDYSMNGPSLEKLYTWSRRWMKFEQRLADSKDGRVAAAQAHLSRMRGWEKHLEAGHRNQLKVFAKFQKEFAKSQKANNVKAPVAHDYANLDLEQAHYYRLAAEAAVARARAEKPSTAQR